MWTRVKTTLRKFWWAIALCAVAVVWAIRDYINSRRVTRLGNAWLQTNSDYASDKLENEHNKSNVRQIEAEFLESEARFSHEKHELDAIKIGNDQSMSDAWNRAFGHDTSEKPGA